MDNCAIFALTDRNKNRRNNKVRGNNPSRTQQGLPGLHALLQEGEIPRAARGIHISFNRRDRVIFHVARVNNDLGGSVCDVFCLCLCGCGCCCGHCRKHQVKTTDPNARIGDGGKRQSGGGVLHTLRLSKIQKRATSSFRGEKLAIVGGR